MQQSVDSLRILAVDDSMADIEILRVNLSRIAGFMAEFHGCQSSAEAIELLASNEVDVIFLDYNLGAEIGLEVLEKLIEVAPEVPVIFCTGRRDQEIAVSLMKAGAADCIGKSIVQPDILKRAVENAVEKSRLRCEVNDYRVSLEKTVDDLRSKNAEIRSFYHVLSHELKTPLTSIREFVSIVLDGLAGEVVPKQREYLEVAQRNCDSLRVILNDILDVTRMETGKLSMNVERFDFALLLDQILMAQQSSADSKGLTILTDLAPGVLWTYGDVERIAQLLGNLLTNAIKFTDRGGRIEISACTGSDGSRLEVDVSDTGRGIAADRLPLIFDRLYQDREEDFSIQGGLGLGLNICREIVRSHGCHLSVASVVGKGSIFSFSLPLHDSFGIGGTAERSVA